MKNKRWIKAIAIASCCLALTAAAVAILHSNWDRWFNAQQQAGIVMKLDGDAEEWDASGLSGGAKTGGIKIPGYEVVRFPKGARDVELPLVLSLIHILQWFQQRIRQRKMGQRPDQLCFCLLYTSRCV